MNDIADRLRGHVACVAVRSYEIKAVDLLHCLLEPLLHSRRRIQLNHGHAAWRNEKKSERTPQAQAQAQGASTERAGQSRVHGVVQQEMESAVESAFVVERTGIATRKRHETTHLSLLYLE